MAIVLSQSMVVLYTTHVIPSSHFINSNTDVYSYNRKCLISMMAALKLFFLGYFVTYTATFTHTCRLLVSSLSILMKCLGLIVCCSTLVCELIMVKRKGVISSVALSYCNDYKIAMENFRVVSCDKLHMIGCP